MAETITLTEQETKLYPLTNRAQDHLTLSILTGMAIFPVQDQLFEHVGEHLQTGYWLGQEADESLGLEEIRFSPNCPSLEVLEGWCEAHHSTITQQIHNVVLYAHTPANLTHLTDYLLNQQLLRL